MDSIQIESLDGDDERKELSTVSEVSTKAYLQDEITWGLEYRTKRQAENKISIPLKRSPINIPFKLCRETQRRDRLVRRTKYLLSLGGSGDMKTLKKHSVRSKTKPSLLDRSIMSQKEYMDLLSMPNIVYRKIHCMKKLKRCRCCRCELGPCPPRIVELSVPHKRLILESWKAYRHVLPTEKISYLNDLLHTNKNLEPRDARYYFKQLDRFKRKAKLAKLKAKRKRRLEKLRGDRQWMKNETKKTAKAIVDYMRNEPLFTLTYKQLMLSDSILGNLENKKVLKKPKRTTNNAYKQRVIEISDKVAVWMDSLVKFVDMHTIQPGEEIVAVPSLLSMFGEEEESESEFESSRYSELEGGDEIEEGIEEGEFGLGGMLLYEMEGLEDLEFLNQLSEDLLERLIRILSNCSDEFLALPIEAEKMPGVTYHDILERLKMMRDGLRPEVSKPFLEPIMVEWALKNEPDQVDQPLLNKIHEVAGILSEWLLSQPDIFFGKKDIDDIMKGLTGGIGGLEALSEEPTSSDISGRTGEDDMLKKLEDEFDALAGAGGEGLDETGVGIKNVGITQEFDENYTGLLGEHPEEYGLDAEGSEKDQEGERGGEGGGEGEGEGEGGGGGEGEGDGDGDGEGKGEYEDEAEGEIEDVESGVGGSRKLGAKTEEELAREASEKAAADEAAAAAIAGAADGIPGVIRGHKPSVVFEHSPDTVCCLSLKIWAIWLLEITHNAHNWTKWISTIIQKVREYAAIVRGDILLPNGEKKVLYKEEWRQFAKETEEMSVSWRQYSKHVTDLTDKIVSNFHNKKVNCCPKCLQDHLIKNVVTAHETLQALTDAMNCAGYWQRCLDEILEQTMRLTNIDISKGPAEDEGEGDEDAERGTLSSRISVIEIEEIFQVSQLMQGGTSDESLYEIEEMDNNS